MKPTSIRIDKPVLERLNGFKAIYDRKTLSDTVEFILDYIESNNIVLREKFSSDNKDILNKILSSLNSIDEKTIDIFKLEDKNTTRVIKILQAQERDILKPLLTKAFINEAENVVSELGLKDENLPKNNEPNNKIILLESELISLQAKLKLADKKVLESEKKYFRIKETYKKNMMGKFVSALTEEEFKEF